MLRFSSPLAFLATVTAIALALLSGLTLLPHDRYIRFQQMAAASPHYLRAKWIYERIHFDPTPIDVAFIGTSHTQCTIDAKRVEEALEKNGVKQHVVNFAIPRLGRDLHFLIARELLENRPVKTLVVELQEGESRAPHPAFDLLSEPSDILNGPLIVNSRLLEMIAELPLRQASLFMHTRFPHLFHFHAQFDPADYEGQYWNDTYQLHGFTEIRNGIFPKGHFDKQTEEMQHVFDAKQAFARKLAIPGTHYSLPYRYDLIYLEKLLTLAKQKNVKIVFMYMPFLHGPAQPVDASLLAPYGPIFIPADILADPSVWQNEEHMNVYGAQKISDWIANQLSSKEAVVQ